MKTLIHGGTLVTMDSHARVFRGDLLIENGKISRIAKKISRPKDKCSLVDATDQFVTPGFIQSHTHLCQTLARGFADDLPLLVWLKKHIWPMEAGHNVNSLYESSRLGLLEMQKLGTTSILDMATVNHTGSVFRAVEESGMRYWGGKCLMDLKAYSGPLYESMKPALIETEKLIKKWHKKSELIEYALCPRFAVSCSDEMMRSCVDLQNEYDVFIHTHASESKDEITLVKKRTGKNNVDYLHSLGMLNRKTVIVHGVHLSRSELKKMVQTKTPLVHCPSSNLKLASGVAPTELYTKENLTIGLGADGAPCNNSMDPFMEMRLAALIQKPLFGSDAMPAKKAMEMATLGGAKVLCKEKQIGSLEVGKLADIVTIDRSHPSVCTVEDPYSAIVYSCSGRDVKNVFINGKQVVKNGVSKVFDEELVKRRAKSALKSLLKRM